MQYIFLLLYMYKHFSNQSDLARSRVIIDYQSIYRNKYDEFV